MKRKSVVWLVSVLMLSAFLAGCGGGGKSAPTGQQEINSIIDRFQNGIKNKDLTGVDSFLASTVHFVLEDDEWWYINDDFSRTEFKAILVSILAGWDTILDYKIKDRQMIIGETEATVRAVEYTRGIIGGVTNDSTGTVTVVFRKANESWFITSLSLYY